MANIIRNFIKGKMNKSVDERLIPDGEYVDAINVRMGSTENSEIGVIENAKGNSVLTALAYNGNLLSTEAKCIGAFEDGANETIYWFVHDSGFTSSPTGKLDLIVSLNVRTNDLTYHVVTINDGGNVNTTLNFNPSYLINSVDMVEDLLFFTDDYNPPRFINITRDYDSPQTVSPFEDYGGDPDTLEEYLQVIKRPPVFSPTIELLETSTEENYLEDRYICFAYRYRYADGDYSATSPFSPPAFTPNTFNFDITSFLNEGMTNRFNAVRVTYNTGGPLVVGIDLLFKEAQNGIIKVIRKLNKKDEGIPDNTTKDFLFDNSNIFTILPDSEILRLYDNVPKKSLAQTIMGNRLIYGNYVDGYDLTRNGYPTKINYSAKLIDELSSFSQIPDTELSSNYNTPDLLNVLNAGVQFDFDPLVPLTKGSIITFDFGISHSGFHPSNPETPPVETSGDIDISFSFSLPQDYNNAYEMSTSTAFINKIGNNASAAVRNIQPVYDPNPSNPNSCDGYTFTDLFNCKVTNTLAIPVSASFPLGFATKYSSAPDGTLDGGADPYLNNRPISIISDAASPNTISFVLPYMNFVGDLANPFISSDVYIGTVQEFFQIDSATASYTSTGDFKSLHSNRNYEVGIIYLDEYSRASTTLVSANNAVHVPCSNSVSTNKIQVNIPTTQIAPEWARYYKFAVKADEENYDIIYSNIYYNGTNDGMVYFKLEGENSRKVESGDRLTIKSDTSGAIRSCEYLTVLEKETFATDDIISGSLAGTYMKISRNNITLATDPYSIIAPGEITQTVKQADFYPLLSYPVSAVDVGTGDFFDYDIPAGTTVKIDIEIVREGGGNRCEERRYSLHTTMRATADYNDLFQFLVGENFQDVLDTGTVVCGDGCEIQNVFITEKDPSPVPTPSLGTNYFYWQTQLSPTASSFLHITGTRSCEGLGKNRDSSVSANLVINRTDETIIFETQPSDTLPDVWFESSETFDIDPVTGYHDGNEQPQTATDPAIINTDFFNCFAFGNGAESYKIRDSIVGKTFNLGNRIYTTSELEYREADRDSDLTYSGIYNQESNVNKLNEFNIGLLNYKALEQSFGPIQKLFGRETDILTLQEDKISYVLQGKDLLSDAGAGSALTAVPQVLGTQIARVEEYGISNNPESFVQWGADKYFTDSKRGAVLQLKGNAGQSESLTVISEQGMRTWFRDLFIESFNTQKLGGFDPYMDEYVLSSNDILLPEEDEGCTDCGVTLYDINVTELTPFSYCVDAGDLVGNVVIIYDIEPGSPDGELVITYDASSTIYTLSGSGTVNFDKNSVGSGELSIEIRSNAVDPTLIINSIRVLCPSPLQMTIVPVCFTSNSESGQFIHNEYSWTDGSYISPVQSELIQFITDESSNPIVSDYRTISAPQGGGIIPSDVATVQISSNKFSFDNFTFDPLVDKFKYLRTNTLYTNSDVDMQALSAAATLATPIVVTEAPDRYYAEFAMPSTGEVYLYLIWDYRTSTEVDLCFGSTKIESCCGCA